MGEKVKSSLLCLEAIRLLPYGDDILQQLEDKDKLEHQSFISVLKRNPLLFVKIQTFRYFRFLVIQRDKSRHWNLRYDGRHLKHLNESMPLEVWLLDQDGTLMEKRHDSTHLPPLHSKNFRQLPQAVPLWQLLELPEAVPDPTSFQDTVEFLMTHHQQKDVEVNYILAPGYGHKLHNWNNCGAPKKNRWSLYQQTFFFVFCNGVTNQEAGSKTSATTTECPHF